MSSGQTSALGNLTWICLRRFSLGFKPALLLLSEQPQLSGVKKLSGRLEGSWRVRVSDWRIIYDIDDKAHIVAILDIGPRKGVYR
jgi:mRNA interferase RelE/StbE